MCTIADCDIMLLIELEGRSVMEQKRPSDKKSASNSSWPWYKTLLLAVPALIPLAYIFANRKERWSLTELSIIGVIFSVYCMMIFMLASRFLRNKRLIRAVNLASPLIELPLNADLRAKLSAFAAAKQQQPAVAAFELLDQEIPRFEQEEERDRARRDNEHLRQQSGQGAFLVAVTTEILRRLLLISGAHEADRKVWRSHISETAVRIVSDALDHHKSLLSPES
ncbi:MAG: hypothetical protein L0220_09440 [Acidobacteria bacterium]|nr:hypothetical protein [Acidobacteriota bacterium]